MLDGSRSPAAVQQSRSRRRREEALLRHYGPRRWLPSAPSLSPLASLASPQDGRTLLFFVYPLCVRSALHDFAPTRTHRTGAHDRWGRPHQKSVASMILDFEIDRPASSSMPDEGLSNSKACTCSVFKRLRPSSLHFLHFVLRQRASHHLHYQPPNDKYLAIYTEAIK